MIIDGLELPIRKTVISGPAVDRWNARDPSILDELREIMDKMSAAFNPALSDELAEQVRRFGA